MKISNNYYTKITRFNFCAGKTRLYTDFDGTYFPFSQDSIRRDDKESISKANKMYSDFRNFTNKAKGKFSILITTGRNKWEMFGALNDFKKSKLNINLPNGYIFNNGVEEIKDISNENLSADLNPELFRRKEDIKQIISKLEENSSVSGSYAFMSIYELSIFLTA